MLNLDAKRVSRTWEQAGVTLTLRPLDRATHQAFAAEATDEKGQFDQAVYAQRVGQHCIVGWSGVVDEHGEAVAATPAHIDRFMLIEPAQLFVLGEVRGLTIHLAEETAKAKNV